MEWNEELVMEFLDLYEKEPMIWNYEVRKNHWTGSDVYDAWRRIQAALSVKYTVHELKYKKETLMTTFRKLKSKVQECERAGELFQPKWFAYEKMDSFLSCLYSPNLKTEIVEISPEISEWDEISNDTQTPAVPEDVNQSQSPASKRQKTDETAAPVEKPPTPEEIFKISSPNIEVSQVRSLADKRLETGHPKTLLNVDKRIEEAYRYLKHITASKLLKPKAEKDESQVFCELLCLKLRALDDDSRERAMHKINNLMFHLKRDNAPNIPSAPYPYYQEPGYYPGYGPQWQSGPYQQVPVAYGHPENYVSRPPIHERPENYVSPPPSAQARTAQKDAAVQKNQSVQKNQTAQKNQSVPKNQTVQKNGTFQKNATAQRNATPQKTTTAQRTTTTQTATSNTPQPGPYRNGPMPMAEMAQPGPYPGGPMAQSGPYPGGPMAQSGPYPGGPMAQSGPYPNGPVAQHGPYRGGSVSLAEMANLRPPTHMKPYYYY